MYKNIAAGKNNMLKQRNALWLDMVNCGVALARAGFWIFENFNVNSGYKSNVFALYLNVVFKRWKFISKNFN